VVALALVPVGDATLQKYGSFSAEQVWSP
jgi:hypothetical protein